MCHNVFIVWPKTTLLLPVWPSDTKRLDTPVRASRISWGTEGCIMENT